LKKEKELITQEAAHLRIQVDDLSRLQHPREFKLLAPTTLPLDGKIMREITNSRMVTSSIGFNIMDRNLQLDAMVDKVIGRWKGVVKEARGASSGLPAQRSLSGESAVSTAHMSEFQSVVKPIAPSHNTSKIQSPNHNSQPQKDHQPQSQNQSESLRQIPSDNEHHITPTLMTNGADMGSDPDADADADMEEDDYIDMNNASHPTRPPEGTNFHLMNGNTQSSSMDGVESATCVQGYIRIGV